MSDAFRWVLIDSCGATATLAVARGGNVLASEAVPGREFSADWPGALRRLLEGAGWGVDALEVVGVVHGPGSFTGVRVGLAVAKGLCEAVGAKLIAVSRLKVLASFADEEALAVLDAGRGEFYVRTRDDERLSTREELIAQAKGKTVVTAESWIVAALDAEMSVKVVELGAVSALALVERRWREGSFDDVAVIDANYVRGELDIYARKPAAGSSAK